MHGVILGLHNNMETPDGMFAVCDQCAVFVVLLYCTFGAVGFAGFRNLIDQSIVSNLESVGGQKLHSSAIIPCSCSCLCWYFLGWLACFVLSVAIVASC